MEMEALIVWVVMVLLAVAGGYATQEQLKMQAEAEGF